jgi:hypothetical protein
MKKPFVGSSTSGRLFWTIWQYSVLAAMLLSVILLAGIGALYKSNLPLRPDPSQNRILPLAITGSVPVYANAHERNTWDFTLYAFFVTGGLFLLTGVTAQYLKDKQQTNATQII